MDPLIQKIILLVAFGLVMMFLNLKAGYGWLKWLSFVAMLACFAGAACFVVLVVLA